MRSFILVFIAVAGCSKQNPDVCCTTADQCLMLGIGGITPCDSDRVCNMDGSCVVPMCKIDADCGNDGSMICDMYGECVPAGSQHTLTVQIAGSGSGSITSTPPGIACSSGTCTGTFDPGTQVQLVESAAAGSFLGWAYGCRGTDSCTVTMSSDQRVGALFGVSGEQLWTKQVAADGNDWARDVVATADGNLVTTGTFAGVLTLGSTTLSSGDSSFPYTFVAKLDGWSGDAIWAKAFPVDTAISETVDDAGGIYIAGNFTGTADFGNGHVVNSSGDTDVFVAKLSPAGDLVWLYSVGGSGADQAEAIAFANGAICVVGSDHGITIGASSYPLVGAIDGFVIGIDAATGALDWGRALFGSSAVLAVSVNSEGASVLVTGGFSGSVDFGSGSVAATGTSDGFVAEYTSGGSLTSLQHFGEASSSVAAYSAVRDVAGNLIMSGTFNNTYAGMTTTAGSQAFIAKYSSGTQTWAQTFITAQLGTSIPSSLAFSESGNVVVSGIFCNDVQIGVTPYTAAACTAQNPLRSTFIASLRNSSGTPLAAIVFAPDAWLGDTTKAATDGRLYSSGRFSGTINFPTGALTANAVAGKYDAFVTAFAP
jgi:hypothetical protein